MHSPLYKYSPGQMPPENLEATFVGRGALLDHLVGRVRQWADGAAPEHTLLTGPRGIGKTHLIRLLAHRIGREPLSAPVEVALFPEESYGVGSADELLVTAWRLLPGRGSDAPPGPADVGARWVLDRMREAQERNRTRFLLLVDGLDLLLDQMRPSDETRLHGVLTTEPHLFLVATAPQVPEAVVGGDRPLRQIFRTEPLRPFTDEQVEELFRQHPAGGADDWERLQRPKIEALAELTGGNPRLLLMLRQALELRDLPDVVAAFRALLDDLTPYYKHIVESRAPQQRKLLRLAALHGLGVSPTELAAESGLPERQVSALLGPLVKDRLLRRVRRPGSRAAAYPFVEPLLRMWLQTRSSPEEEQRVTCLVEFFRLWYEGQEEVYTRAFHQELLRLTILGPSPMRERLLGLQYLANAAPSPGAAGQALEAAYPYALDHPTSDGWSLVLDAADRCLQLDSNDGIALVRKAHALGELGRLEKAIEIYDAVFERFGDRQELPYEEWVALALVNKGVRLGQLGRSTQEIEAYECALERFGNRPQPSLAAQVALALYNKGVRLGEADRWHEAVELYDRALGPWSERSELPLALWAAQVLLNKGMALGRLDRSDEALEAYDRLVKRFGGRSEPALEKQVARALFNKAFALGQLGRSEQEISGYDALVERFGDRHEPALDEEVARALVNKAVRLGRLNQMEGEIEIYDALLERFADRQELALEEQVARTLFNKGAALGVLGRFEEAIRTYDRLLDRCGARHEVPLEEQVARALLNKGVSLYELGRYEDALTAYERALELRADDPRALHNRGIVLSKLGRHAEALADFNRSLPVRPDDADTLADREKALLAWAREAALAAAEENRGDARRALAGIAAAVELAPVATQGSDLVHILRALFSSGDAGFCAEALERLGPLTESADRHEPFRRCLEYVQGGRDPYYLEKLNPDLRRAVTLVVTAFDERHPPQPPADDGES